LLASFRQVPEKITFASAGPSAFALDPGSSAVLYRYPPWNQSDIQKSSTPSLNLVFLVHGMPYLVTSSSYQQLVSLLWGEQEQQGEKTMMMFVMNTLTRLHDDESAQGLVEYLLILALVAFAATAGMGSLASGLNSAFSKIGVILGSYIK
jgi:pilus assembly protein Flp/PilA